MTKARSNPYTRYRRFAAQAVGNGRDSVVRFVLMDPTRDQLTVTHHAEGSREGFPKENSTPVVKTGNYLRSLRRIDLRIEILCRV
jgi:hypothetical protein